VPTPERLGRAVAALRRGKVTIRAAALQFNVPKSTLVDRSKLKGAPLVLRGRKPVLPEVVEKALAKRLIDMASRGFGVDPMHLGILASSVADELRIDLGSWVGGQKWRKGFYRRNPSLATRTTTRTVAGRLTKYNRISVEQWFAIVGPIAANFSPSNTWNVDDAGINIEKGTVKACSRRSRL